MEFRRAISRVDGVLMVVAFVGCIHALFLNCHGSLSEAISATDRIYLEPLSLQGTLSFANTTAFATDWGQLRTHLPPSGVVHPTSVHDIATVVAAIARSESELTIAARGLGSSTSGQAQAQNGIVIKMTSLKGIKVAPLGDAASNGMPFVPAPKLPKLLLRSTHWEHARAQRAK